MAIAAPPYDEFRTIEKLREQELEEARTIQGVMLPSQPLRSESVTISHEFHPAAEVGGDYLDYFSLSDGTIGLYIGDVSGKGPPPLSTPPWPSAPFAEFTRPANTPAGCFIC
ncbi:MAG TPA: hypothetical protein VII25_02665 [Candidatus Acidoferrum sp.]